MPISKLPFDTIRLLGSTVTIPTPPSLVKELLDNALDATATTVEVLISANTIDKIQARDNGAGIPLEDVDCLGKRAHTSKLRSIGDLDGEVKTLGFRGEALFGTNGVADGVWITTRTKDETVATKFKLQKGVGGAEERKPISAPIGTTVMVEGLFGDIPVRKQQAEKDSRKSLAQIRDLMLAYVLARPHLKLTLKVVGDTNQGWRHSPTGEETVRDVVLQLLGKNLAAQCAPVEMFWSPDPDGPSYAPTITMHAFLPISNCGNEHIKGKGAFISVDQRPITSVRGAGKKIATSHRTHLNKVRHLSIASPFMQVNIGFSSGAGYDPNVAPLKDDILFLDEERVVDCFEELCRAVYKEEDRPQTPEEATATGAVEEGLLTKSVRRRSALTQALLRDSPDRDGPVESVDAQILPTAATFVPDDHESQTALQQSPRERSNEGSGDALDRIEFDFQDDPEADAEMLRLLEQDDPNDGPGSANLDDQPGDDVNTVGDVSAPMRTKLRVDLSRKVSDATDEDSAADATPVQVPAQPVKGNTCNIGMSRALSSSKTNAIAHQMEDITRYMQPRKRGEEFQIATNDTATAGDTPGAVEQTISNGRGRTPLFPVDSAALNQMAEDHDSLFDGSEPDIPRPHRALNGGLNEPLNRAGPRLQEHNLHLLQQALAHSPPPANMSRSLTQTTLSPLGRAATYLRTPPSSDPRHSSGASNPSFRQPTHLRAGSEDVYLPGGRRADGQGAHEGSNSQIRASLGPRRGLNSVSTTVATTIDNHAQPGTQLPRQGQKFPTPNPYDRFSNSRLSPG